MKHTFSFLTFPLLLLAIGCMKSPTTGTAPSAKTEAPSQTRQAKIEFLEFHADWCGPCQRQKPIVQDLQKQYANVEFRIIDFDKNIELAKKYKVTAIPRMLILVDGKIEGDFLGLQSRDELARGLDKAIARSNRSQAP